jgi:hypothetical protein
MRFGFRRRLALGAVLALAAAVTAPSFARVPESAVGVDDGFALSLQATGDFTGNFEPCG